jgi:NTP pyrophosphatase (non-canonical NTP hydrolase)
MPDRPALDLTNERWGEALPSLAALGVTEEMLEVAEEIAGQSDVLGVERHRLELIVRAVIYLAGSKALASEAHQRA